MGAGLVVAYMVVVVVIALVVLGWVVLQRGRPAAPTRLAPVAPAAGTEPSRVGRVLEESADRVAAVARRVGERAGAALDSALAWSAQRLTELAQRRAAAREPGGQDGDSRPSGAGQVGSGQVGSGQVGRPSGGAVAAARPGEREHESAAHRIAG